MSIIEPYLSHSNESLPQTSAKKHPILEKTRPDENFECSNNKSIFNQFLKASLTEKQMLSHPTIKQIISKSAQKTVQHRNINHIPIDTQLYKVPQQINKNQYKFDSIPPTNPNFVSTSSQKTKQINGRLSGNRNLSTRLKEIAKNNKNRYVKETAQRINSLSNDKRVSISGLVSYNFNSVNARRSLGNIPNEPEEETLAKKIKAVKQKNSCSIIRRESITRSKPNRYSKESQSISNAAMCDFHTKTDKFLKVLLEEKEKDEKIFGDKMEKLNCIKQYMEKEKVGYEQARHIVETIEKMQTKKLKQRRPHTEHSIDDDVEIAKRRKVFKKKRIVPKHLYFTD